MTDSYIYHLLKAWARFIREGWDPKLGYDKINNILKVPGREDEEIPDDVLHVHQCIGSLSSELRESLNQYYVERNKDRVSAKNMNIGVSKFHSIRRQAEERVTGYLLAVNNDLTQKRSNAI